MEYILNQSLSPAALFFGVIFLSWLWEDIALVCCALLAADGRLSVFAALASIFIGISSGDLALYVLGRYSGRWRWLRYKMLKSCRIKRSAQTFKRRVWSNIFVVRFIPGLRTLCFTSCGYWRVDIRTFVSAMMLAGVFWVVSIFFAVFFLGSSEWLADSPWKWSLIALALMVLCLNNFRPGWASSNAQ